MTYTPRLPDAAWRHVDEMFRQHLADLNHETDAARLRRLFQPSSEGSMCADSGSRYSEFQTTHGRKKV